ncbi:hypothetical protein WG936_10205 [Corynebacterium sp. H127]|uniref:hypothetical protein n=1 Tax=Corynebacterium sp. H127 TaxID=3133418 RepID=UPI0030A73C33
MRKWLAPVLFFAPILLFSLIPYEMEDPALDPAREVAAATQAIDDALPDGSYAYIDNDHHYRVVVRCTHPSPASEAPRLYAECSALADAHMPSARPHRVIVVTKQDENYATYAPAP